MRLGHLHLPGITRYSVAAKIQTRLVDALLRSKTTSSPPSRSIPETVSRPTTASIPDPIILTAEFLPVYTCGRREIGQISAAQEAYLRSTGADFVEALRGGQTTFHGPGQLVAYPIIDLRRHFAPPGDKGVDGGSAVEDSSSSSSSVARINASGLSVREYIFILEQSLINTLARFDLPDAHRNEQYPGVWMSATRKIASVGVHLRRYVTSHGVGLNVATNLSWFDHIVACGIDGVEMTSVARELELRGQGQGKEMEGMGVGSEKGSEELTVSNAARIFVQEFARCCFGAVDGGSHDAGGRADADGAGERGPAADSRNVPSGRAVEIYTVDAKEILRRYCKDRVKLDWSSDSNGSSR